MDSEEASYLLPDGERVWVIKTSTAADLLPQMLERFRFGHMDPLIFGEAGRPEGVVVPFELWRAHLADPAPQSPSKNDEVI